MLLFVNTAVLFAEKSIFSEHFHVVYCSYVDTRVNDIVLNPVSHFQQVPISEPKTHCLDCLVNVID